MPVQHNFEHLPLLLRYQGQARIRGGGKQSPQTKANKNNRAFHSGSLRTAAHSLSSAWQLFQGHRQQQNLPVIPKGMPVLLQIDPNVDLDFLREKFDFEIVAEQEEGYVIVASADLQLTPFLDMVNDFAVQAHGSATIASVHRLFDDPTQDDRLKRILSERLYHDWPGIDVGNSTSSISASLAPVPRRFPHIRTVASGTPMPIGPRRRINGPSSDPMPTFHGTISNPNARTRSIALCSTTKERYSRTSMVFRSTPQLCRTASPFASRLWGKGCAISCLATPISLRLWNPKKSSFRSVPFR